MLFMYQFKDVMIGILLGAAAISLAVGGIKDAVFILIIVILNAIIGCVQEYRAGQAIEALKNKEVFTAIMNRKPETMKK